LFLFADYLISIANCENNVIKQHFPQGKGKGKGKSIPMIF